MPAPPQVVGQLAQARDALRNRRKKQVGAHDLHRHGLLTEQSYGTRTNLMNAEPYLALPTSAFVRVGPRPSGSPQVIMRGGLEGAQLPLSLPIQQNQCGCPLDFGASMISFRTHREQLYV